MPVIYIGIASVTHQIVINKATPAVNHATLLRSSGGSEKKNIKNINIPKIRPNKDILFLLRSIYSHSIVAGGLEEISRHTRDIPETLFIIFVETSSKNPNGNSKGLAVIKSIVLTALKETTFP